MDIEPDFGDLAPRLMLRELLEEAAIARNLDYLDAGSLIRCALGVPESFEELVVSFDVKATGRDKILVVCTNDELMEYLGSPYFVSGSVVRVAPKLLNVLFHVPRVDDDLLIRCLSSERPRARFWATARLLPLVRATRE